MAKTKLVSKPADADGVLVVDVSNLVHRSLHAYKELKARDGRPSGHVFGSVRLLLSTLANDLDAGTWSLALCYDGPGAKDVRRQIDPTYKANRDLTKFNPMPQATPVLNAVPGLHIISQGREGDDAVVWMAQKCSKQKVVVLSGDRDLWGLLQYPHVSVISPNLKRYVIPDDFVKPYSTTDASKIPLAKALFGDSSDGVAGVKGLLKKQVSPCINHADTKDVETFMAAARAAAATGDLSANTLAKLEDAEPRIHSNYQLVQPMLEGFGRESVKLVGQGAGERGRLEGLLRGWDCNALVEMLAPLFGA
jgi:5'-3' exonuclease